MSDIKLFEIKGNVRELKSSSYKLEKSLQGLIEQNLDTIFGINFLASEFSTGAEHRGRMDTIGIDENGFPVIIEYKRSSNENIINQGLFYLDWLMGHRKDFEWLVMEKLGKKVAKKVDWNSPRLLCIASDFTKYDEHAVKQMNHNIELIRYRRFEENFLLFELVNVSIVPNSKKKNASKAPRNTVEDFLEKAPKNLKEMYEELKEYMINLGDDVQVKTLRNYFAFKRIKNFACVEIHPKTKTLLVYVKINPDEMEIQEGYTRDVRKIGHFGTGDLEIRIKNSKDLERSFGLIEHSYNAS